MPEENTQTPEASSKSSEPFGNFPNASESFGTIPQHSEPFGDLRKDADRKEYCTLTVREVARLFEAAGVARTERSIINWCQPNKLGVCRLDNYFDPNERKYFISAQSVELVVQEEKAKAAKGGPSVQKDSETLENLDRQDSHQDVDRIVELERQVTDLKIANRVKDGVIDRFEFEREGFAQERQQYVERLMTFSRQVGELETKLLQLEGPDSSSN